MTIQFTQALRIAGAEVSAGTQQTLSASVEADFVHRGVAIFVTPNPSMPDNRPLRMGLVNPVSVSEVLFDQGPDGRFLFTQYDATYGKYLSQISIAGGTTTSLTSKTAIAATEPAGGLKNAAGTLLGSGDIFGAWWLTPTRFLFAVRSIGAPFGTGCAFLYLCNWNGSAWTVGSNGPTLLDNKQAVRDLGTTGGTSVPNNIILHARSLAHNGAGKIMIGDYNVASGRVNGSTNDQVQVHWSDDYGVTWSKLASWNTSGNQIRHVHGCKYDKYTGDWYILLGDAPNNAVVRWNGDTSSLPPDNTAIGSLKTVSGWEVLQKGWPHETGDLSIHSNRISYLPDDTGVGPVNMQSVVLGRDRPMSYQLGQVFEWASTQANPGRAPLISCNTPGGGAIWGSLFMSPPDATRGYDFWSTDDGIAADKIATATDYGAATAGALFNIFVAAGENKVVISGTASRGVKLQSNHGSIVATLGSWDGKVRQLN